MNTAKAALEPKLCVYQRWNRTGHLTNSRSISSPSVFGSLQLCHCADKHSSAMFGHLQNKPAHSKKVQYPQGGNRRGSSQIKCFCSHLNPTYFSTAFPPFCPFFLFERNFLGLCSKTRRWPGARIQLLGSRNLNAKPLSPQHRDRIL